MIIGRVIRFFGVRAGVAKATQTLNEQMAKNPKMRAHLLKMWAESQAKERAGK